MNYMKGKVCLVTGANSGLGYATALGLAKMKATVVMLCRNAEKGEEALMEIVKKSKNDDIHLMLADMESGSSIKRFADEFISNFSRLDVLVNNAGSVYYKRIITKDGLEANFASTYMGTFILTYLLKDLLIKSVPSRIVNISGSFHSKGKINFNDIDFSNNFDAMKAGVQAILARLIFTYELDRRWRKYGVTANALHPGAVRTRLQKKLPWYYRVVAVPVSLFFKSPEKGAGTIIYLASSPEVENISGKYFINRKPVRSSEYSYNKDAGKLLWEISEKHLNDNVII
jgi:NAD(P)-dependent dehydrogenase (short-subunit alcohol dehydrogenase family)